MAFRLLREARKLLIQLAHLRYLLVYLLCPLQAGAELVIRVIQALPAILAAARSMEVAGPAAQVVFSFNRTPAGEVTAAQAATHPVLPVLQGVVATLERQETPDLREVLLLRFPKHLLVEPVVMVVMPAQAARRAPAVLLATVASVGLSLAHPLAAGVTPEALPVTLARLWGLHTLSTQLLVAMVAVAEALAVAQVVYVVLSTRAALKLSTMLIRVSAVLVTVVAVAAVAVAVLAILTILSTT